MNQSKKEIYLQRLKLEISPALGCTEPAAVALACAYAAKELDKPPITIKVLVSKYILKNGMNVGIPGTGMIGLDIAVALGALSAEPQKELMVLNKLSEQQKNIAKEMVKQKAVEIGLADTNQKIYIEAVLSDGKNIVKAIIAEAHTNLVFLEKNGEILFENNSILSIEKESKEPYTVTLEEIHEFIKEVLIEDILFLREVTRLNKEIAQEGLKNDYGLMVGQSILNKDKTGLISSDIGNYAVALTAAAADARMAGCDKPVMSTAGSGNQGITASLPIAVIGWKLDKSEEVILRSLALSILVTAHTKHYIGKLSVLCGCSVAASIGSCCGIIHLYDGTLQDMNRGINSMIADIAGVICDGAKPGCALKIATAVNSAIRAASMALNGVGADIHDGIVEQDVERSLSNLGTLGNEGMLGTNRTILDMMLNKQVG